MIRWYYSLNKSKFQFIWNRNEKKRFFFLRNEPKTEEVSMTEVKTNTTLKSKDILKEGWAMELFSKELHGWALRRKRDVFALVLTILSLMKIFQGS